MQYIVTELEHDDVLHPEILLHPFHALLAGDILERVLILAVEAVHDVSLEVLQQVYLALQLIGVDFNGVRLAHVHRPRPA